MQPSVDFAIQQLNAGEFQDEGGLGGKRKGKKLGKGEEDEGWLSDFVIQQLKNSGLVM